MAVGYASISGIIDTQQRFSGLHWGGQSFHVGTNLQGVPKNGTPVLFLR